MRSRVGLFSTFAAQQGRRSYSTRGHLPRLTLYTWKPRKAIRGREWREGLWEEVSSATAKSLYSSRPKGITVETLGHAAAKLEIDTTTDSIKEVLASKTGEKGITKVEGEMSWFPEVDRETEHYIKTGETLSDEQYKELEAQQRIMIGEENFGQASLHASRIRNFLNYECAAINSSIQNDIRQYGPLTEDGIRVFTELDFDEVLSCWLNMMEPKVILTKDGDKVLSMTEIAEHGTYYGKGMLEFFRGVAEPGIVCSDSSYSSLQHVCTTAALQPLQAGLGVERFEEIVREVLKRPEFAHQLAIVDLTRDVINEAAVQTQPRYRVDEDSTQTNTTKKTDTPSSDNDESPPSPGR